MDWSDKNKWIEEVMTSVDGIQPVTVRSDIYEEVVNRIKVNNAHRNNIRSLLPRIAAAAALLLVINALSVYHATIKNKVAAHTNVYQNINEQITNLSEGSF